MPATAGLDALLADVSLDILRWEEVDALPRARGVIPPGTRLHIGFLESEDLAKRVATARAIGRSGFVPVPIIAARRLRTEGMLREYLAELRTAGASETVVVVGGDPAQPRGPYPDAASVIGSGILEEHGVREVSVAGHPDGHPAAPDGTLWRALAGKVALLERRGLRGGIVTQFGFDATQVLLWIANLRARGVSLPVRVGVPGPGSVRLLLACASQCGVAVSAPVAREYGFSLAEPTARTAPDRFIRTLAAGYATELHGQVKLHFNSFGGITATANWINQFRLAIQDDRVNRAP